MGDASPFGGLDDVRRAGEDAARAYAAQGGRVCGYMTAAAPVELMTAAGFRPLMMLAGDVGATPLADHHMETLFDAQVRGVLERLLRGEFDYLSAIVLPRAGDSVHRLYYYLCELKRTGAAKLPEVLLADIALTPDAASAAYAQDRMAHLWAQLRAAGDAKASAAALRAAIALANERIDLLQAFAARRREGRISAEAALAVFTAARLLDHGAFVDGVTALLARPVESVAGPRVVVCGSPQSDAAVHALIETAGGVVVGDYHGAGELSVGARIADTGEALAALTARYRDGVVGQRSFEDPAQAIAAFAAETRAGAVVFTFDIVEEALTWDYPQQVRALRTVGVKTLRLPDRSAALDAAARGMVAGFLSELEA